MVCTLHRGVTAGLLERIDPEARLVGFVPKDPDVAGCLIDVAEHDESGSSCERRPRTASLTVAGRQAVTERRSSAVSPTSVLNA